MSRRKGNAAGTSAQESAAARPARLRGLVGLLAVLALLAVAANAWLLTRPQLAPLPKPPLESLEPDVAQIITQAQSAVESDPQSPGAWGNLGAVLRAHEFGPQANDCLRNAEQLDPTDYRWPYLLGASLSATDRDASVAALRRAAALAERLPHVQLRLAEALLERQELVEAEAVIDRVLAYAASYPRAQLAKARLLMAKGELAESRSWAERAVAGAPAKRAPRLLLAQLCRRLGDAAGQAREMAALEQIPDGPTEWEDPDVASVLALRRDRAWQIDRALESGEYATAERLLREQLAAQEGDYLVHFRLGIACFFLKKLESSAEAFRRTIELKPDHVEAHYNLGHTLMQLDRNVEAAAAFAEAVRLEPDHAFARINLADLLLRAGRREEARAHLEIAVRLAPQERRAHELLRLAKGQ
jgi:tetratricopeptide (TPR) repeat protein